MTGFDLPQNFHSDPESLLRKTRARLVSPRRPLLAAEPSSHHRRLLKLWPRRHSAITLLHLLTRSLSGPRLMLVLCNITNKIRKCTDTDVTFTQEYSRVSYPLGNVSALSMGSGSSKDTRRCRRDRWENILRSRIYV